MDSGQGSSRCHSNISDIINIELGGWDGANFTHQVMSLLFTLMIENYSDRVKDSTPNL